MSGRIKTSSDMAAAAAAAGRALLVLTGPISACKCACIAVLFELSKVWSLLEDEASVCVCACVCEYSLE